MADTMITIGYIGADIIRLSAASLQLAFIHARSTPRALRDYILTSLGASRGIMLNIMPA